MYGNRKPKEKRMVELPAGTVPFDLYEDLTNHALRSAIWYLERFPSHSSKIRSRLREKGYPDYPVTCVVNSTTEEEQEVDFIEQAIEQLTLLGHLDDRYYIEQKAASLIRSGVGERMVHQKLRQQGVPEEEIREVLENADIVDEEQLLLAVEKAARKIQRSGTYLKKEGWQRQIFLKQKLFMKGFDGSVIDLFLETQEEEDDDE